MYYQQYSTYRHQWYGPQPQHQQYLSCMHQQQHQTQPTQHHHQQPPPPQPTPSWHHTEGLLDAGVVQAVGATGQVGHWEPPQLVAALSPPATLSPPQELSPRPPPARSPYEWMKKPSYQTQPNPGKTRTKDKYRVVYTDHQRLELEKEFHYSRYITIRRKAELAASLALSERQVKIWFQNRRAKERKQVKKREELIHKEKMQQLAML